MSNPLDPRPLLTFDPRTKVEEKVGELIPKHCVVKLDKGLLCGYCATAIVQPLEEIPSGREFKCPECSEFMWVEVRPKEDGSLEVHLHPGRRPRP